MDEKFSGYDANLNQTEQDDLDIHKTRLALEKEKELKAIEHQIDEEISVSTAEKNLLSEKDQIRKKIEGTMDPDEK